MIRLECHQLRSLVATRTIRWIKISGYSPGDRLQILLSGQRNYARMVKTEREGGRPVNRPGNMGERKRRIQKLIGKKTWFKKKKRTEKKKGNKASTVTSSEMSDKERQNEL